MVSYSKLTPQDHVLLRSEMYIGLCESKQTTTYVVNDQGKIVKEDVVISEGFLNCCDELLINASDNFFNSIKMKTKMTYIKVTITPQLIAVQNDGNIIPIVLADPDDPNSVYLPQRIFSEMFTSSNYEQNSNRITGGLNGLGAKLANLHSTKFTVEICNGKQLYNQEFQDQSQTIGIPVIKKALSGSHPYVKVQFYPKFDAFDMECIDLSTIKALNKHVTDVCGTLSQVKVYINDVQLKIQSFKQYLMLYAQNDGANLLMVQNIISTHPQYIWEVFVKVSTEKTENLGFINRVRINLGTHFKHVLDQIYTELRAKLPTATKISKQLIKDHLSVYINAIVPDPRFREQYKDTLINTTTQLKQWFQIDTSIIKKLLSSGLSEIIETFNTTSQNKQLKKIVKDSNKKSLLGIPKLEDANLAGKFKKYGKPCTLILTEGDSAKSLAMVGLEFIGRDCYGVFPLKGKLLNVRDVKHEAIYKNQELNNLMKIIGLEIGKSASAKDLRYQSIMIMTDQDLDGFHIKGLIINFFNHFWDNLLIDGDIFIYEFITPLLKLKHNKIEQTFFSQQQYTDWLQLNQIKSKQIQSIKYYKGLGTSTAKEAKEYFSNLQVHKKSITYTDHEKEVQCIDLAFRDIRTDDRKQWMQVYANYKIPNESENKSYEDFINGQLVQHSIYNCQRSIPSIVDGLKPCQRKILFSCFKKNLTKDLKVVQLAGYVAEQSSYHHGETSLCNAIVQMAQNYTGTNNINLLQPIGQFGDKNIGNSPAEARYIYTKLSDVTRLIFLEVDCKIVKYLEDDNKSIEPQYYIPVIPMVLVNGVQGVGTGWSTHVLSYNPIEIIQNLMNRLQDGKPFSRMKPYVKGFSGKIQENVKGFAYYGTFKRVLSTNTINITQIPPTVCVTKYKELVQQLQLNGLVKSFTEHHTNTGECVNFQVKMVQSINSYTDDQVYSMFKLIKQVSSKNFVLFDIHNVINKYQDEQQILKEFYLLRRAYYQVRIKFQLEDYAYQLDILKNKQKFIRLYHQGVIKIVGVPKQQIILQLQQNEFRLVEGSFKYMLDIKLHQLSEEKLQKLEAQIQELEAKINHLMNTTDKFEWLSDLNTLLQALKQQIV